jgi:hypothetical protein
MKTGSGIHVILRLLPRQSERLQYGYFWWEGFMIFVVEMTSDGMIYIPSFMTVGSGIYVMLILLMRGIYDVSHWDGLEISTCQVSWRPIQAFKQNRCWIWSYTCNRPWRPIWLWDVEAPTCSLHSRLTDGGKVVSLTRHPPFIPQEDSWYSFLLEAESTPGP